MGPRRRALSALATLRAPPRSILNPDLYFSTQKPGTKPLNRVEDAV
jgi:hypothetical protein